MENKLIYLNLNFHNYKNKTTAQVIAMNELGYQVSVISTEGMKIQLYEFIDLQFELRYERKPFNNRKQFHKNLNIFLRNVVEEINPKYIYIRRLMINCIYYKKSLKLLSKKSLIIYEIPTFPYDKSTFKNNFYSFLENIYLNIFLKKYINHIGVILQKKVRLNSKMVEFNNGVDCNLFELKKVNNIISGHFEMVFVAHLCNWHGLDRLIKGIFNYNGNLELKLHIISNNTEECKMLKNYVLEKKLENNIFFLGEKNNSEIFNYIKTSHVAIGSLGYHRRGAKLDTSLKNKEYCAMGIPFIHSIEDTSFNYEFKYKFKVSNDDCDIIINDIISWFKSIENDEYSLYMRDYALKKLNWNESFKQILE